MIKMVVTEIRIESHSQFPSFSKVEPHLLVFTKGFGHTLSRDHPIPTDVPNLFSFKITTDSVHIYGYMGKIGFETRFMAQHGFNLHKSMHLKCILQPNYKVKSQLQKTWTFQTLYFLSITFWRCRKLFDWRKKVEKCTKSCASPMRLVNTKTNYWALSHNTSTATCLCESRIPEDKKLSVNRFLRTMSTHIFNPTTPSRPPWPSLTPL